MAVAEIAYRGIVSEEIGKQALKYSGIRLLIFDPEREEISGMDRLIETL